MGSQWRQLAQRIARSNRVVFFGGARVSTESGIPNFHGAEGLFHQDRGIPIERVLSIDFFRIHPQVYWEQFAQENAREGVAPNATHGFLAELGKRGSLLTVVTQNIGELHQSTGFGRIFELHGNWSRLLCMGCGRRFSIADFDEARTGVVPRCPLCAYAMRPDIVLYGEMLGSDVLEGTVWAITDADTLIVAGTNLVVYPAAGLADYYSSDRLVLVNTTPTPYDLQANLVIRNSVGKVFAEPVRAV